MSKYLLYNGSFYNSNKALITASNRGLRYGDGLFETMRVKEFAINLPDWHFERLFSGLQLLSFELPSYFTAAYLSNQVLALCKKNEHGHARVRLTIIRGNGGLYDPENHFPNCIIETFPLPDEGFQLNQNGLVTGIYQKARKAQDDFSGIKSNNYLPYALAALHAKQHHWNDAYILNSSGTICDATIANVFVVKDEKVTTCPLIDGCIAGVMRRFLLENLASYNFEVKEQTISAEDLLAADEVFLTNTVRGIRWVQSCAEKTYGNRLAIAIYNKLLKKMM